MPPTPDAAEPKTEGEEGEGEGEGDEEAEKAPKTVSAIKILKIGTPKIITVNFLNWNSLVS